MSLDDDFKKNDATNKLRDAFKQRRDNALNTSFAGASVEDENIAQESNTNIDIENQTTPNIKQPEQLDDIVLNKSHNIDEDSKSGYMMFGVSIVVVFLITIVLMQFVSDDYFTNLFSSNDDIKIVQKKPIAKKLPKIQAPVVQQPREIEVRTNTHTIKEVAPKINLDDLEIPAVLKNRKVDIAQQQNDNDLKKIFEEVDTSKIVKRGKISKEEPAITPKIAKKQTNKQTKQKTKLSKQPKFYVQIGAFFKSSGQKLLRKIKKQSNYKYFAYPVVKNNVEYTKILIGPYNSRAEAVKVLPKIKKDFLQPKAYVLKL